MFDNLRKNSKVATLDECDQYRCRIEITLLLLRNIENIKGLTWFNRLITFFATVYALNIAYLYGYLSFGNKDYSVPLRYGSAFASFYLNFAQQLRFLLERLPDMWYNGTFLFMFFSLVAAIIPGLANLAPGEDAALKAPFYNLSDKSRYVGAGLFAFSNMLTRWVGLFNLVSNIGQAAYETIFFSKEMKSVSQLTELLDFYGPSHLKTLKKNPHQSKREFLSDVISRMHRENYFAKSGHKLLLILNSLKFILPLLTIGFATPVWLGLATTSMQDSNVDFLSNNSGFSWWGGLVNLLFYVNETIVAPIALAKILLARLHSNYSVFATLSFLLGQGIAFVSGAGMGREAEKIASNADFGVGNTLLNSSEILKSFWQLSIVKSLMEWYTNIVAGTFINGSSLAQFDFERLLLTLGVPKTFATKVKDRFTAVLDSCTVNNDSEQRPLLADGTINSYQTDDIETGQNNLEEDYGIADLIKDLTSAKNDIKCLEIFGCLPSDIGSAVIDSNFDLSTLSYGDAPTDNNQQNYSMSCLTALYYSFFGKSNSLGDRVEEVSGHNFKEAVIT